MQQYHIHLVGNSPLIMHRDNLEYSDMLDEWRKAPENKGKSKAGDDRTPAWTWLGYIYHDRNVLGIPSENIMTCLRVGGTKVVQSGKKTFKSETQCGMLVDGEQFNLYVGGKEIPVAPFEGMIGNASYVEHVALAREHGFDLFAKRAKIGTSKHVRVRPIFHEWEAEGTITVFDESQSGITHRVLEVIFAQSGAYSGLGDWRPSSPTPGRYGMFSATVKKI